MYDLIRTVEYRHADNSESILHVIAMKGEKDAANNLPGVAVIHEENSDGSIIVNSVDQANQLHDAMLAALSAAGHDV